MNSELVVVFGGNGFIGSRLVELLLRDGCRVRVASRQGSSPLAGVECVAADVSNPSGVTQAIQGATCVYSLSTGGGDNWDAFERDIVGGARNLADACTKAGVRRLIYVSSIAALYLGDNRSVPDGEPADPLLLKRSYYARAKALAEGELLRRHKAEGLPVTIARPGVVMGCGGPVTHSGLGCWTTDLDCIGWGAGNHPLPFVLVQDVAEALRQARTARGMEGLAFNLAGDVQITAREFVQEMAERSKRLIHFYPRPLRLLWATDVFKWLVKIAARKAENPFPYFRDYASRSLRSVLPCEVAREKLAWRPVSDREQFLQETIDANLPPFPPDDLRLGR